MMDRPTPILRRRITLLLVGLALAGTSWLVVGTGPPSPDTPSPAAEGAAAAVFPDTFPARVAAAIGSAQPKLLGSMAPARWLSPPDVRPPMVLLTGFPAEQDQTTNELWRTRDLWMSLTAGPADVFRSRFADASAQSRPDVLLEIGPHDVAQADPDRVSRGSGVAEEQRPRTLQEPAGSLLLPRPQPARRSEQLERIAQQADRQIRHGFELAGRRAYFAARSEFIRALRLTAQGLDAELHTSLHSRSLAAGLTAVEEAEDFLPDGSRLEADLDVSEVAGSHRTPVLKDTETDNLTSMLALKCYFTFAQEQLAAAAGREVAGSMALHALGKLYGALATQQSGDVRAAEPKAMAFYQAALLVWPQNPMAANDRGVLLARCGDYQGAEAALKHGLSLHRQSTGWHNLAVVYGHLGQRRLAQRATKLSEAARRAENARRRANGNPSHEQVRWVDPQTFAQSPRQPSPFPQPMPVRKPPPAPRPPAMTIHSPLPPLVSTSADVQLCQALGPAAPCPICAVDCSTCNCCRGWESARMIAWQAYAQGEYVGHERLPHVAEYRLRVDDELDLVYRLTRDETTTPYQLNVGDTIQVESFTDPALNRELIIQPDGTITLRLLGQIHATNRTVPQLREYLEKLYEEYYKVPAITVTPLKVNTKLEDLRATVDRRAGVGGQSQLVRVTPEGTISLPAIGSVYAQGLNLTELQTELNERYRVAAGIEGIEVIPVLVQRAPRYVYVLGEVGTPGRFELSGPTTVLQAISMAGSWNNGANLQQIVVFRRGDDWRLMATMIDLDRALHGKQPCPPGEIWLSDSDVIIVPKSPIKVATDFIELVFTRGIYGVLPMNVSMNFAKLSSL